MKHIPHISIYSVNHKDQAYETVGNFIEIDEECTDFEISKMSDWRMEYMVAVHEFLEYGLVKHAGIDVKSIDTFDKAFEKKRKKGNTDEPGDNKKAPYYEQHQFATSVEKMLCKKFGIKWKDYEKAVNSL